MLADNLENNSSGKLTEGIETDSTIIAVVEYIQTQLDVFCHKYQGEISAVEDTLNENLFILLQRNIGPRPYFFKPEKVQAPGSGRSAKTDIGVMAIEEQIKVLERTVLDNEAFFEIECKRLPTLGHKREKEYVIGHTKPTGGIERFKKKIHGKDLKYAAIIGYIQKNDTNHWFLKVNGWIGELISSEPELWKEEDKLLQDYSETGGLDKFRSKNFREEIDRQEDFINLFHFWINLS
jgi:hypothetical protein